MLLIGSLEGIHESTASGSSINARSPRRASFHKANVYYRKVCKVREDLRQRRRANPEPFRHGRSVLIDRGSGYENAPLVRIVGPAHGDRWEPSIDVPAFHGAPQPQVMTA